MVGSVGDQPQLMFECGTWATQQLVQKHPPAKPILSHGLLLRMAKTRRPFGVNVQGCPNACLTQHCADVYKLGRRVEITQGTSETGAGQYDPFPIHGHQGLLPDQPQALAHRGRQVLG